MKNKNTSSKSNVRPARLIDSIGFFAYGAIDKLLNQLSLNAKYRAHVMGFWNNHRMFVHTLAKVQRELSENDVREIFASVYTDQQRRDDLSEWQNKLLAIMQGHRTFFRRTIESARAN